MVVIFSYVDIFFNMLPFKICYDIKTLWLVGCGKSTILFYSSVNFTKWNAEETDKVL